MQVNARRVSDEANVFSALAANKLFVAILLGEASLQVGLLLHKLQAHFVCCHGTMDLDQG